MSHKIALSRRSHVPANNPQAKAGYVAKCYFDRRYDGTSVTLSSGGPGPVGSRAGARWS